jgi:hypothetical protein
MMDRLYIPRDAKSTMVWAMGLDPNYGFRPEGACTGSQHGQAPLDRGTPELEATGGLTIRGATFEPIGSGVLTCLRTLDTLNTYAGSAQPRRS